MPEKEREKRNEIFIKGARVHNLKNIDVVIPRDKFIVITGLSGSGKSSLAFDTLYAEGQRRYVESLSAYARQFLGRIDKPDVDYIHGIPPAVAIEQKVNTRNPRSTVGTSTEIYDYLKLLYARIGRTYSPVSGKEVKRHSVTDVVDYILSKPDGTKMYILAPFHCCEGTTVAYQLELYLRQGITRIEMNGTILQIEEVLQDKELLKESSGNNLIIDRIVVGRDEDMVSRFGDSVKTALSIGKGICRLREAEEPKYHEFTDAFEADGIVFDEPSEHMFSFNNPLGACPVCEGYGQVIGIDEDLVIPNKSLSVYQEAIVCWKGEKMSKWLEKLIYSADKFDFPIHTPYYKLSQQQQEILWKGNRYFKGIRSFFEHLEEKKYKIQYRVMLSRYRGKTVCHECRGGRLKKEASYVKISGKAIHDLVLMSVDELTDFFKTLKLNSHDTKVGGRLLTEIKNRLGFLQHVGLNYLTLNRLSATLSGGESQRINLATSLGSALVGSLYILDEPSIGLHSKDTFLLIEVLKELRDMGNTLVVVEHDEDIIRAADMIIDIGPRAGRHGGEVVFSGDHKSLIKSEKSLTAEYLTGLRKIDVPHTRRKWNNFIHIKGARENNLKNISVKIPLNIMTAITGVSGSGKSSLVKGILYPALNKRLNGMGDKTGKFDFLEGDVDMIKNVEFVDQNPIGKSSRSNPVTYLKAYDEIRKLFADQTASTIGGFKPSHFSFNIDGGRCEECLGDGFIRVEMQFMADVNLICESCHGKRFKDEILEVKYSGKNIYEILEMTVDESIEFFGRKDSGTEKRIVSKLKPLQDVGLGYIKLGQSSSTLSGGESQRVKLAYFLSKEGAAENIFFIFDEPTTGLHFHDIRKLLDAFNALIKRGHSILVIEHNLEVVKSADWVIDLGPEGGDNGGEVVFEGTPEQLAGFSSSYTAGYLKEKLGN
ncbi:MAG: excinuclease ABC subunit UvrA [Bacteroidales bacterium]|nr:excinuclease ABC subunit UvrA [Bacteroidales bacterium]MCB9013240.1 excinuclease ABC subunit UvrA [Bacteroidales bacterium]